MHLQQYRSSKGTVMDSCLDKISEVLYVGTGHSAVDEKNGPEGLPQGRKGWQQM
jgi:hypothetical protein